MSDDEVDEEIARLLHELLRRQREAEEAAERTKDQRPPLTGPKREQRDR
jgi:hypothetical protein